ncbi:hypothetical protein [Porcipelethomonas sp.]|uniref:hypothetical protein n=1 Tax=Porcipelethomonas sp. TaxID=2981675 RepID=UPI003EF80626
MKKSVYSLVLADDVIEAIDNLAYQMNTSRSNLINQILAEHVSYITPERRIKNIFDCVRTMMDNNFQVQGQASDAMLSIRSPLRFKYKPTIRYRVELLKEIENSTFGFLSVSFRTQSSQLIEALNSFFQIWYSMEKEYIGRYFEGGVEYEYSSGKFIRHLKFPDNTVKIEAEKLGRAIGEYIRLLDSEIKIFFDNLDFPELAVKKMENIYNENIKNMMII